MKLAMVALTCGSFLLAALMGAALRADDDADELEVGSAAPTFTCTDDKGGTFKSTDVVTQEGAGGLLLSGRAHRRLYKAGLRLPRRHEGAAGPGVEVVGVSGDQPEGLALFKKVHDLNFTLLTDSDGSVVKKFGVSLGLGGQLKFTDSDGPSGRAFRNHPSLSPSLKKATLSQRCKTL